MNTHTQDSTAYMSGHADGNTDDHRHNYKPGNRQNAALANYDAGFSDGTNAHHESTRSHRDQNDHHLTKGQEK